MKSVVDFNHVWSSCYPCSQYTVLLHMCLSLKASWIDSYWHSSSYSLNTTHGNMEDLKRHYCHLKQTSVVMATKITDLVQSVILMMHSSWTYLLWYLRLKHTPKLRSFWCWKSWIGWPWWETTECSQDKRETSAIWFCQVKQETLLYKSAVVKETSAARIRC